MRIEQYLFLMYPFILKAYILTGLHQAHGNLENAAKRFLHL